MPGSLTELLQMQQQNFSPIVPFRPGTDRLIQLDLTAANTDLTNETVNNTAEFSAWINKTLAAANARYAIGGYAEHRTVYSRSHVFDGTGSADEPRRLHLGMDIWGRPGTPVSSPLNGLVHSFAFNNRFGDYGATIILSHQIDGYSFHTLYGHLSLNSIKNLQAGDRVDSGDIIAEFGIPAENGQWPPHLHFQVIENLKEWKGDYPGVCKFSEKEIYLANSPDPDLILKMNQFITRVDL